MAKFNKDQIIPENFYRVIYQGTGDVTDMYEWDDFDASLTATLFADALKNNEHYKNVKVFAVTSKDGEETTREL